jgi:hypothetical protein
MENIKNSSSLISAKWNDQLRTFKCYFCDITRRKYMFIQNHMLEEHPNDKFFNCDYVACVHMFFTSEEEKNKHMEEQHDSVSDERKVLRCVYCDRVFLRGINFRLHMKEAHRHIIVRCTFGKCTKYLKSEEDRLQHLKEEHSMDKNVRKCVYCEKLFPSYRGLWSHLKNHHLNSMIKCNQLRCDTYFKSKADRQKHIVEMHQTRRNAIKCIYCDQWVISTISKHMRLYHNHIAIKCNYTNRCGTFFRTKSDRDEHIKLVHLAGKQKLKVDCIFCGISYYPKGSSHVKFMHGDIAIKCSQRKCGKYFKKQEDCDKHFEEYHHHKEKSKTIFCPKCRYTTNSKTLFQQHSQNMHGKEKLKCTQCPESEKTYRSKQLLKQHISASHVNPLDMQICPHCNTSTSKRTLRFHLVLEYCSLCRVNYLCAGTMKEHKKWCKLKCEICREDMNNNTALLRHVKKEHKDVDIQDLTWLGDLRYR